MRGMIPENWGCRRLQNVYHVSCLYAYCLEIREKIHENDEYERD